MIRLLLLTLLLLATSQASEALVSWNDTVSKQNIIEYVQTVTNPKDKNFIPEVDRIAVFDNDGTLWSEQPLYFQLYFAMDRVKSLASEHPEWKTEEPFKSVLANNIEGVMKSGEKGLLKLVLETHSGMSDEAFSLVVKEWINSAKHPRFNRLYKELVYQPMLELLVYMRANGFKTFIVSGGGIDFMRPFASQMYGIPSHQIIGSSLAVKYENRSIYTEAKIRAIDDKHTKPIHIHYHIGKRPVAAFGNSDGDFAMMQYTEANQKYKTLQLYVHHTDENREWMYDRKSHIGKLDKGLDYAKKHNWTVVDMKKEWKIIYPFEKER